MSTNNQDAVRLADNLARYHNVVDALLAGGADSDNGRSALARLRSWEKTAEGFPPHIVSGERLAMEIQDELGLVLDAKPDLSPVWKPEFDELRARLCRLAQWYGQDGYDTSLAKALMVSQHAARLAERLVARFGPTAEPQIAVQAQEAPAGQVPALGGPDWRQAALDGQSDGYLSVEDAAKLLRISDRKVYRMMKDGLPYMQLGKQRRIRKSDLLAWASGTHPDPKKSL